MDADESGTTLPRQAVWLQRAIGLAGVCLMLATHPLWISPPREVPQIPLLSWFVGCLPIWDWVSSGILAVSFLGLILASHHPRWGRWCSGGVVVGFSAAFLVHQQRWQPWGWEFVLLLLTIQIVPRASLVSALRLVIISLYFHSGLSKLDHSFMVSHGDALLNAGAEMIGWKFSALSDQQRAVLAGLLPLSEIVIALGLAWKRTRPWANIAAIILHGMLLLILGPLGLGHELGVLIWNVYFIAQNLILFREADASFQVATEDQEPRIWRERIAKGFVGIVVLVPFLEPFGLVDPWLGWAVYAPRPARVTVWVAEDRLADLPESLIGFVAEDSDSVDDAERWLQGKAAWKRVWIGRWVLEETHAPIAPQARVHVGVALALAERCELGPDIKIEWESAANRWTGERSRIVWIGAEEIQAAKARFVFNTDPRYSGGIK